MTVGTGEPAHPLALALSAACPTGRILLLGVGNGRNLFPFSGRGAEFFVTDEDAARLRTIQKRDLAPGAQFLPSVYSELPFAAGLFAGVLTTHVLQHGRPAEVAATVRQIGRVLAPGGLLYAALASQADIRFGAGVQLEPACFAPEAGEEAGVAHYYPSESDIRALFAPQFTLLACRETDAAQTAGKWAHPATAGYVHWFIQAQRNEAEPELIPRHTGVDLG